MAFYDAEQRRQNRAKADIVEAVATGYAGCKTDKGVNAMQRLIQLLRRD